MLDKLYFTEDVMERYRCRSKDTARRYMHQMGAKGTPLFVTEDMMADWEAGKRKGQVAKRRLPRQMIIPGRRVG